MRRVISTNHRTRISRAFRRSPGTFPPFLDSTVLHSLAPADEHGREGRKGKIGEGMEEVMIIIMKRKKKEPCLSLPSTPRNVQRITNEAIA